MQEFDFIFAIIILIMSVVIHEVSHGYAAFLLGDPTAKYAGRLTLNPLRHLDFLGSFLIPLMTYFLGGVIFGWAKPVPYNPYNLKDQRWGPAAVAIAGPGSNFLTAIFFGLLLRLGSAYALLPPSALNIFFFIIFINVMLGIFNLIPIPPLDGSKILFAVLPYKWHNLWDFLERYGFFILILLLVFFLEALSPLILGLSKLIAGVGF